MRERTIKTISLHRLIKESGTLWEEATRSPFLDAIESGHLPDEAFNRWLVQDYKFGLGLVSFLSLCLAKAPRKDWKPLIRGLEAMDGELDWFEKHAKERGLDFNVPDHEICRSYVKFLAKAGSSEPYSVLAAILYGVEAAYFAAWSTLGQEGPYREFIVHWSNPLFADYVAQLGRIADANKDGRQQEFFNEVLKHEKDFWCMSWGVSK